MSLGQRTTEEIKEETTHHNAVRAVNTYLELPAINFAVACSRCRRIVSRQRVKDPGSVFGIGTLCENCVGVSFNTSEFEEPLAIADSLVPGSFVLAPFRNSCFLFDCLLWPAMVDFSIDERSSFRVLDVSGKAEKYYVTFITPGDDRTFGGWFPANELRSWSASREDATEIARKYIEACETCRQAGESLQDRVRLFSLAAKVARKRASRPSEEPQAQQNVESQLDQPPEGEVRREPARPLDASLRKEFRCRHRGLCGEVCRCSERTRGSRILPSAANKVIFSIQKRWFEEARRENLIKLSSPED